MFLHSFTLSNISTYIRQMWLAWRQKANGWLQIREDETHPLLLVLRLRSRNCVYRSVHGEKSLSWNLIFQFDRTWNQSKGDSFKILYFRSIGARFVSPSWCVIYTLVPPYIQGTEEIPPSLFLSHHITGLFEIRSTIWFSLVSIWYSSLVRRRSSWKNR